MGISSIASTNSMLAMQMITASSTDPKSKNIQNDITDVKQQIQKLSSNEELPVNEKTDERQKLQKELTSLDTELEQRQEELRRSQKRELMIAELRKDQEPTEAGNSEDEIQTKEVSLDQADAKTLPADDQQTAQPGTVIAKNSDGTVILKEVMSQNDERGVDTEKEQIDEAAEEVIDEKATKTIDDDMVADASLSHKEMHTIMSADSSAQQASRQAAIITKTKDGIAILKGEIHQDELRGADTEKKQAELEKMEQKEQRATTFQFSVLGKATNTNGAAVGTDNAFINAMKVSQEDVQASQQFYVSLGY